MHKVLTSYPLHKFSHAVIIIIIIIIITVWLQYTTLSADCLEQIPQLYWQNTDVTIITVISIIIRGGFSFLDGQLTLYWLCLVWCFCINKTDTNLMASFPGQSG